MFATETEFIVRYAETDQMGIVHHSNYPIWFEAGRTDFIRKLGIPYSEIEAEGILLPLSELKCCYRGFAKYEDRIVVKTSIREFTCAKIVFYYEVFKNDDDKAITMGETVHAWTNRNIRPLNIKKLRPDIYDLIVKSAES